MVVVVGGDFAVLGDIHYFVEPAVLIGFVALFCEATSGVVAVGDWRILGYALTATRGQLVGGIVFVELLATVYFTGGN